MQISPTMNLAELVVLMGRSVTDTGALDEAERMRDALSDKYPGLLTDDIPDADWQLLCISVDPSNEPIG